MNNITTYIFEKLKINKDIVSANLIDQYNVGDICLFITHVNETRSAHPNFITIDVVKIKRILSTSFICDYLTKFSFGDGYKATQLKFRHTDQQEKDYKFIYTRITRNRDGVLIPSDYCKEVIEYIESGSSTKINFYNLCRNKYKNSLFEDLVVEAYLYAKSLIWKNVTGIKKSSIDKIKQKLGI